MPKFLSPKQDDFEISNVLIQKENWAMGDKKIVTGNVLQSIRNEKKSTYKNMPNLLTDRTPPKTVVVLLKVLQFQRLMRN